MRFNEDAIRGLITAIGYAPQDGKSGIYLKSYPNHDGYCIFVDFNNQQIIYDSEENPSGIAIKVWERTTSNFSQAENFVVLECVNRLLEKGYAPTCIELEWTYPSGHGRSGRLDILVKTPDGVPFLMVECKTWGSEYEKEKAKMSKNGGQLFTYYSNLRATRYLCLYTSKIDKTAEYQNSIVDVEDAWISLSEVKDIYSHWNKNFKDNGIFDSYAVPYDVKHRALTYGKLETLKEEHSGKIYHQILTILRHNAISDRPNAFNKLLNLFVCKIIDEADKNPEDELDFQWREGDTDESLQLRLNDLYKKGMWRFLEIEVIDYEQREVSEKLANIEDTCTKDWIMKMYTDTRLKKSPNFAFVEVQDDRTFALNAKVVREIVELLQVYKFRYEQKHEFLGNFFENLLNDSMKQESGQFFTPVPITRFIISSLPLAELVQKRVNDRKNEPLPTVIDYACGSGHFLTEYMSQMQNIIDSGAIDLCQTSPAIRSQFQVWQGIIKFQWAQKSVYGIDLDNRLVKTTKVSAFFNGDGEANIVWANGLDSFTKSKAFRGKLVGANGRDNGKFDLLISNPPYSVEAFKSTVQYGKESFELYDGFTDSSSEIECLFVERMKQLLKEGGWVAVILPSSILTNGGIHARAREILLKYFKFKAIVELGSNTFMKTGTNTVILFLERRGNDDYLNIRRAVDRFFTAYNDVAVSEIENAFSAYVSNVYDRLTLEDYISLFSAAPSEAAKAHELYEDYVKAFGEDFRTKAIEVEKEKLLYFLLTYNQTVVLVKTGKGKEEKKFLGYEFSERRGHEGLHYLPGGTKLYDETDPLNSQKAGSYIYHAFLGDLIEIDESLVNNISYGRMSGFIEYGTSKFEKKINLGKTVKIQSKYPLKPIAELVDIISGVTYDKGDQVYEETDNVVLTADNILPDGTFRISKKIYLRAGMALDSGKKLYENDIFICMSSGSKSHVGKCTIIPQNTSYFAGGFMGILRKKAENILPKFLWSVLISKQYRLLLSQDSTGANINNIGSKLAVLKIPVPPLKIQQKVVDEIEAIERNEAMCREDVEKLQQGLLKPEYFQFQDQRIGDISVMAKRGKSAKYGNSNIQIIKSGQARGYLEFDFSEKHFVADGFMLDERKLQKGDILINSTGVGTAGRVTLFDLDGDFVVDSHITIIRLDKSRALPKYVLYALANIGFKQIEAMADGQSGQIELPLDTILAIKVPLPSLGEQQKIVEEIRQYEDQIARQNAKLDTLKAEKGSILKKYL